jgi:hypothetical protein
VAGGGLGLFISAQAFYHASMDSPIEVLLAGAEEKAASEVSRQALYQVFIEERARLEEAGAPEGAERMQWAAEAFMFHTRPDRDKGESYFGPLAQFGDHESPGWSTISDAKLDFYAARATQASDPIIIARYADIVWEKRRDHKCGRLASDAYIRSVDFSAPSEEHLHMVDSLCRGTEIAMELGDDRLVKQRAQEIIQTLKLISATENYWLGLRPCALLIRGKHRYGTDEVLDAIDGFCLGAAAYLRAKGGDDLHMEREFLSQLEELRRKRADQTGANLAARCIAESFEQQAESREGDSAMIAASFYSEALKAYKAMGDSAKVHELLLKVRECNERAVGEFGAITSEVRVPTAEVEKLIDTFTGGTLDENLHRLASNFWPDLSRIRHNTNLLKQETPLQFLIGRSTYSSDHRLVGHASSEEDLFEQHVLFEVRLGYQVYGSLIHEILRRLRTQHGLTPARLTAFLCRSEAVGHDRREFLQLALRRYFATDYASAIHLLVPQLEHVLRSILPRLGIADTFADDRGLVRVLPLDRVLSTAALKDGFGENLWTYFRTFLTDQTGGNFRNDVAHGLIEWSRCDGVSATLLIHLLLSLTLLRFGPPKNA